MQRIDQWGNPGSKSVRWGKAAEGWRERVEEGLDWAADQANTIDLRFARVYNRCLTAADDGLTEAHKFLRETFPQALRSGVSSS